MFSLKIRFCFIVSKVLMQIYVSRVIGTATASLQYFLAEGSEKGEFKLPAFLSSICKLFRSFKEMIVQS